MRQSLFATQYTHAFGVAAKRVTLAILALGACAVNAQAHTLDQLKKLPECELKRLFDQAPAPTAIPVGYAKGRVLLMTNAKLPRLKARLASTFWKGKHFCEDGGFINQFVGFQALRSNAELGTSWHDGKPCIVIEYPPNTPLFGNNRDELREIAPGLYLARLYERCPCPRMVGYFAIQIECPPCQGP
jgi:hypothetical protein